METVYLICAIVGGTLIVCQFVLTLIGIGGDSDTDTGGHDVGGDVGGHDMGGHDAAHDAGHVAGDHGAEAHHVGHGSAPTQFLSMLTIRTLSAATAFFGLAGLAAFRAGLEPAPTLALAVVAAACALLLVDRLLRWVSRLNVDGTIRIERAVGAPGTVYLSVPGNKTGHGKVHVNLMGRTIEYNAVTNHDALTTGAAIVVVGVVNADTVEVAPATVPAPVGERTSHG